MSAVEALRPLPEIALDVARGLSSKPKTLPPWLFYDAEGSRLFEQITSLPEYYLTRTERDILSSFAFEIVEQAGSGVTLVELGSGTAAKTGIIIAELFRRQLQVRFFPIDVSPSALEIARRHLSEAFPNLRVQPITGDYTTGFGMLPHLSGRKLVLYLGSSIGNFEPAAARAILRSLRAHMDTGDCLLLGTDLVKSSSVLIPAYDDAQGITARFNQNVLVRINRELGGHFDLSRFRHVALWNESLSRMEMHLESTAPHTVRIDALNLEASFAQGERIHTENSYKYTTEMVTSILAEDYRLDHTWTDARNWFALHLARVA